jgi:hypothetical protein
MKIIKDLNKKEVYLTFSEKEIEIITQKRKLIFTEEGVRHFGNHLVKIVADLNTTLSEEVKQKDTKEQTEIQTK